MYERCYRCPACLRTWLAFRCWCTLVANVWPRQCVFCGSPDVVAGDVRELDGVQEGR